MTWKTCLINIFDAIFLNDSGSQVVDSYIYYRAWALLGVVVGYPKQIVPWHLTFEDRHVNSQRKAHNGESGNGCNTGEFSTSIISYFSPLWKGHEYVILGQCLWCGQCQEFSSFGSADRHFHDHGGLCGWFGGRRGIWESHFGKFRWVRKNRSSSSEHPACEWHHPTFQSDVFWRHSMSLGFGVLGVLDDESSGMEVYQSFPKASTTVTPSGTTLLVALDGWRNLFNSPPFWPLVPVTSTL